MRFEVIYPGSQLPPEVLDAYVSEHRLDIPVSLRDQLLEQNGGALRDDYCVPMPDGTLEVLSSFFGVGMRHQSAELAWNAATFDGRVPAGMLAFADDPGGNLYLIDSDGAIWFWDHEREGDPDAQLPVNESLDGFLQALVLCPD